MMQEGFCVARRSEQDMKPDAAEESTTSFGNTARQTAKFVSTELRGDHGSEIADNLMGLYIPTAARTATRTRPRDLKKDSFIASLVRKRPLGTSREGRKSVKCVTDVTVDTKEDHEVAEVLCCLGNIKMNDSLIDRRSVLEELGTRSTSIAAKRKSHRPRRATVAGVTKRRSYASRRTTSDDLSQSSASFEKLPRNRTRSRCGRICSTPFQTVFREGGKRVYHPQTKSVSPEQPVRRHVIHQQPSRPRQKPQPLRVETPPTERVMLNGHSLRQEDRAAVPDERYLPVAVMDALKGIYGRGLICTNNDEPKHDGLSTTNKKHDDVHSPLHAIQLKCEERSNESEAGTPLSVPRSNNTRHIRAARSIAAQRDKMKEKETEEPAEEQAELTASPISFGQKRIEDVLKNLPPPPVKEEPLGLLGPFYPSLPMPSSFSEFSMSLPSLPQSLIHSLQNSAAHVAPLQPRFPPFSGQPPPLARASEPWETNR